MASRNVVTNLHFISNNCTTRPLLLNYLPRNCYHPYIYFIYITNIRTGISVAANVVIANVAAMLFFSYYLLNTLWYCTGNCTLNKLLLKHTAKKILLSFYMLYNIMHIYNTFIPECIIYTTYAEKMFSLFCLTLWMIAAITLWPGQGGKGREDTMNVNGKSC